MIEVEKPYLQRLIAEVKAKRQNFTPDLTQLDACEITYLPTRNRPFIALGEGLSYQCECKTYNAYEKPRLRAGSKHYYRIDREDGRIRRIETYTNGKPGTIYHAAYEPEYRYLFPEYRYSAYSFVTHTQSGRVTEEYQADGHQIVYEAYGEEADGRVEYYRINYVPTGKYPVLEEVRGSFDAATLDYAEESAYVWWEKMEKHDANPIDD